MAGAVKKPKLFVVLGMHRSGTSLLTKSLEIFNIDLGTKLLGPQKNVNEKGFFEDENIVNLNIKILNHIDSDWFYTNKYIVKNKIFIQEASEILIKKFKTNDNVGIKDPRITFLLPFWEKVFKYVGVEFSYIFVLRNPKSVVSSLSKRDNLNEMHSYLIWLSHVMNVLKSNNLSKTYCIGYENFINNPKREISKLSKFINLPVNENQLSDFVDNFIDIRLNHTKFNLNDLKKEASCPDLVFNIYSYLDKISKKTNCLKNNDFDNNLSSWMADFSKLKIFSNTIDSLLDRQKFTQKKVLELENKLLEKNTHINTIYNSRTWKVVSFISKLKSVLKFFFIILNKNKNNENQK